jgi:hypothetical protein
MRYRVSVISIFLLIASNTNAIPRRQIEGFSPVRATSQEEQKESKDTPLEFLLTSAASDFHAHQSHTTYFRKVHFGRGKTAEGGTQYILCGQFQDREAKDKAEWMSFVTIKTSGYEQYIGDSAANLCKRPSVVWDKEDLSSSLQSRFDSIK